VIWQSAAIKGGAVGHVLAAQMCMCRFSHRIQPCQGHNCKYQILTCMRHGQTFTTCRRKYRSPQAQWYVSGRKILLRVGICQGLGWCVRTSCMRQPWSYRNRPPMQPMQVHVQPCTIDMKALIRHRAAFQANC
jgi:hypothetical protein